MFPVSDPLLVFFGYIHLKLITVDADEETLNTLSWCDEHFIYKYN